MKKLFVLAAVSVIAAVKTMASDPVPVLNVSCTAVFYQTNYEKNTSEIQTTMTESLNNKTIYNVISNAVAAQDGALNGHLPADGYIAYAPEQPDGNVDGFFYVTNKSGFYYQLSGYTNESYYSFMELDSEDINIGGLGFGDWEFSTANDVGSYNVNEAKETATVKDTEVALLYIHSNPSDYDDMDFPYEFDNNEQNAIEIRGVFTISGTEHGESISGTGTLTGTGNIILNNGFNYGVVTSGKATIRL